MNILALNLGSSTLKAAWFSLQPTGKKASGTASESTQLQERVSVPRVRGRTAGASESTGGAAEFDELLAAVVDALADGAAKQGVATSNLDPRSSILDPQSSILDPRSSHLDPRASILDPQVIAHRIVHGGEHDGPLRLDAAGRAKLALLSAWAPMHQRTSLALYDAAATRWPRAVHVAVFDTSWHRTLPPVSRVLPLSAGVRAQGVQRYGFHGLAFQSAYRQLRESLPNADAQRVVLAHLGSGSSLCAVAGGRSVDTTMGLTPLDGLPMETRSGSLDPGVMLHLMRTSHRDPDALEHELGLRSGLLGISQRSGDMRELLDDESAEAKLAVAHFVLRVAQGICSMATSIGGIDDLVFSGGIGSNAAAIRTRIAERLAWLGVAVDAAANTSAALRIDAPGSRARVWIVTVDEERELAESTVCAPGTPLQPE